MEGQPKSCGGVTFSIKKSEHLPRGDAIISDHQVDAGSKLSALVGFAGGKFRIVEKPALSEAYTVLLFTFSSSGLTTSCVKLIATSRLTEQRLKAYPSKVKIVSGSKFQINSTNIIMVKRLVLFEEVLPLDNLKQNHQNVPMSNGAELHIKCITVDQTSNSNIVVIVTETMPLPCYLADVNNQCDCRYVLEELSKRLRVKSCREISQKLQYDSTVSPASVPQQETLHICKLCGKAFIKAKPCGQICDYKFTKQNFENRPVVRRVSSVKQKSKRKRKQICGCCSKKRKGRDQSAAYIPKRANDYSSADNETQIGRGNNSRPHYKEYYLCPTNCKPYPEFKHKPETNSFPENKTYSSESKFSCIPFAKCRCEEMILKQECSAAEKGFIASTEYCISDSQGELPFENPEFYLICQAYKLKSDKHAGNKYNTRFLEDRPEKIHEQSKKYKLESQRDHVHCSGAEKWSNHITTFDASEKSSDDSTKSTTKQVSSEEEIKEISIQSTESYLVAQRLNDPDNNENKLFVGRMEGNNFQAYPFRNRNNVVVRQYRVAESYDRCRRFLSVTSTSSSGSYLSIGRRRSKVSKTRDC